MKNSVCLKFERLINNDIAFGQQHDHILINELKKFKITEGAKKFLGVPAKVNLSLYDIGKSSVDILSRLRFIYLLSLLEAFGKEYIASRENITIDSIDFSIRSQKSMWQKLETGLRQSTSFTNSAFLAFVIKQKYNVTFSNEISGCFWEIGLLRKCVVHDRAIIPDDHYRCGMQNILSITNTRNAVGEEVIINDKLMWIFIEDCRKFLFACDY